MIQEIQRQLVDLSNPEDGLFLQRYFKTAPGQYGAGDIFRGIRVPALRKLSLAHQSIPLHLATELLQSRYHEDRLLALLILVLKYAKADEQEQSAIYRLYLGQTRFINIYVPTDKYRNNETLGTIKLSTEDNRKRPPLPRANSLSERRH